MTQRLHNIQLVLYLFFLVGKLVHCSPPTYKICGIFQELTQPYDQQVVGLTRMAVEKLNDENVASFQLELVEVELSSPDSFGKIIALQDCFQTNNPIAVIGPVTSSDSLLLSPLFGSYMVPVVSYGATSPSFSDKDIFPFFSRVIPDDSQQGKALVDLILNFNWENVGLIYQDDSYGRGLAEEFENNAAKKGVNIIASENFKVGQSFTSAQMQKFIDSEANIFVLIAFESGAISVLNEALKGGILGGDNVWMISEAGYSIPERINENPFNISQEELDSVRGNLSGVVGVRPDEGQGAIYNTMLSDWDIRNGSLLGYSVIYDKFTTGLNQASDNLLGSMAYDAVLSIGDAVKRTTQLGKDPTQGNELIKSIRETNIAGSTGQVSINPNGDRSGPYSIFNFQIKDENDNVTKVKVGKWDELEAISVTIDDTIVWANGETSTTYIPKDGLRSSANPACPCIDPWTNATGVNISTPDCLITGFDRNGVAICVTIGYGATGCSKYNEYLIPECLGTDPAPHCNKKWCVVDPQNCDRDFHPTFLNFSSSGLELFASYKTCGNFYNYQDSLRINQLSKIGKLRVSYPGSSGSGYTLINNLPEYVEGSFPRFIDSILEKYGIEKEIVLLSDASREYSPLSSFTACVHEIGLGNTDMCIANTWSSPKRKLLASFLGTIYDDKIRLVSFKDPSANGAGNSNLLSNGIPLLAFAPDVWVLIFISLFYAGLVIWIVEVYVDNEKKKLKYFMFFAIQSFTGGLDIRYRPKKGPGMVVLIINSFFVLLLVTLFTAQITSNIIAADSTVATQYTDLSDALERGARICMLTTVANKFLLEYSGRRENIVYSINSEDALSKMDSNVCNCALLTDDEYGNSIRDRNGVKPKCDKVQVGGVLFTLGNTVPVRDEYQEVLSWAVEKDVDKYVAFERAAKADYLGPPVCDQNTENRIEGQIILSDMSGTFLNYFILMTGILFFAVFVNYKRRRDRLKKENVDDEGSEDTASVIYEYEDDEEDIYNQPSEKRKSISSNADEGNNLTFADSPL